MEDTLRLGYPNPSLPAPPSPREEDLSEEGFGGGAMCLRASAGG